jgi:hypothetical protein
LLKPNYSKLDKKISFLQGNQTPTIKALPMQQGTFATPHIKKKLNKDPDFETFNPTPKRTSTSCFLA